jgi:hypothetical protein
MTAAGAEFLRAVDKYVTALYETGKITTTTVRNIRKAMTHDMERGELSKSYIWLCRF